MKAIIGLAMLCATTAAAQDRILPMDANGAVYEQRRYTVQELDALRFAVEQKWLWGDCGMLGSLPTTSNRMSRVFRSEEKTVAVEQMTRTHMLAGHTAKDICP